MLSAKIYFAFFTMLYQRLISAFVGALATSSALASPVSSGYVKRDVPGSHVLHERQLPHWSRTWEKKSKVKRSTVLPMRIGLRQVNLQEGHDLLMERSNPRSENFGKRMSTLEVIDFFAPPKESVEVVRDWLVTGGINVTRITQSTNKQVSISLYFFSVADMAKDSS